MRTSQLLLCVFSAVLSPSSSTCLASPFIRGDANADSNVDVADAIVALSYLFLSDATPTCLDAADANDDGVLDIADPLQILFHRFVGGAPIPPPSESCGDDPTEDELSCVRYPYCGPPESPVVEAVVAEEGGVMIEEEMRSLTNSAKVVVSGTALASQIVQASRGLAVFDGVAAGSQGAYSVEVELQENSLNKISLVGENADGERSAPTTICVIHDREAPFVYVDEPHRGAEVTNDAVTIAGRVSDRLSGFLRPTVTVRVGDGDEMPAVVMQGIGTNGTFERVGVPLELGENTITVTATDELGNVGIHEVRLTRVPIPDEAPQIEIVEPTLTNNQKATVFQQLRHALRVRLTLPGAGEDRVPFADKIVTFSVIRSDGVLTIESGLTKEQARARGVRMLQVRTDVNGEADAYYHLGADAGCGNHRVRVTSTSMVGTVTFCASADPDYSKLKINLGSGTNQKGEIGSQATDPLRVWVNDSCNGVGGVPVSFVVLEGGGKVNGEDFVTVSTSETGHAEVAFAFGPNTGIQSVLADFPDNTGLPTEFSLVALERQAATSFVGLVLDNAQAPISGAACQLVVPGFPPVDAVTDENGLFAMESVQGSGLAHLHVDGHPGCGSDGVPCLYPSLSYEVTIVPNTENSLSTPVLLPKLQQDNIVTYDGTETVELTVAGIEGLKMTLKAGTKVELPDRTIVDGGNGNSVELSLNQVHHDDIPMPMPDGAAPPFAWTLQPAGAKFDPPIAVEYPNMSALAPGSIAYFLSFDHDTNKFEIVASGQVTEDGEKIVTDEGAGLSKSGWGCNCPPYAVTGQCCSGCRTSLKQIAGGCCEDLEPVLAGTGPGSSSKADGLSDLPFELSHRRELSTGVAQEVCCELGTQDSCAATVSRNFKKEIGWARSFAAEARPIVEKVEKFLRITLPRGVSLDLDFTAVVSGQKACDRGQFPWSVGAFCVAFRQDCCEGGQLRDISIENHGASVNLEGTLKATYTPVKGNPVSIPIPGSPVVTWAFDIRGSAAPTSDGAEGRFVVLVDVSDQGIRVGEGRGLRIETAVGDIVIPGSVPAYFGPLPFEITETVLGPPCR